MKTSLILLMTLLGCSRVATKAPFAHIPVRVSQRDILACKDYQKNVLLKSYYELQSEGGSEYVFNEDEEEARASFKRFDISKGMVDAKSALVNNILLKCDKDLIKQFDRDYKALNSCTLLFTELDYFQALIFGMNKFSWGVGMKFEAKNLALNYVKHFSEGNYPLMNRLAALSVLDELSIYEFVDSKFHPQIKRVMGDAKSYVENLNAKVSKRKTFDCEGLDVISDELVYSAKVAEKMRELLDKI